VKQYTEIFVGLDVAKSRHAVAVAEDGRQGEVRYLGEIGADKESVRRLVVKLEKRHGRRLHRHRQPFIHLHQKEWRQQRHHYRHGEQYGHDHGSEANQPGSNPCESDGL
jgi:hypothetical protein